MNFRAKSKIVAIKNISSPAAVLITIILITSILTTMVFAMYYNSHLSYLEREYKGEGADVSKAILVGTLGYNIRNPYSIYYEQREKQVISVAAQDGITICEFTLDLEVWKNNDTGIISKCTDVIDYAKEKNMTLVLIDGGFSRSQMNFETYSYVHKRIMMRIASDYKPEYLVVLNSPETQYSSGMVHGDISKEMWVRHVQDTAQDITDRYPEIKIGYGVSSGIDWDVYDSVVTIPSVNFIGLNIYDYRGLGALLGKDSMAEAMQNLSDTYKRYGKEIAIISTWTSKGGSFGQYWHLDWDEKWIKITMKFASEIGAKWVAPAFGYHLISYDQPIFGYGINDGKFNAFYRRL